MYENERVYGNVPLHAESNLVTANITDATFVDEGKRETEKKTTKYAPLRAELKEGYPRYQVKQYNIIIDVLGGYSREVKQALKKLVGDRSNLVAFKMQKSV